MATYSYSQLEGLWIQAGGSAAMAPLMAAIAEAESSGNSGATGPFGEKGLWQINPSAWGSLATYDPLGNAKAAVHVLSVQGLGAWTTYTNGAYKSHLQGSVPPSSGPPSGGGGGGGSGGGGGGGSGSEVVAGGYTTNINPLVPADTGIETASFFGNVFSTVLDPFRELFAAEKQTEQFFLQPFVGFLDVFKNLTTQIAGITGALSTFLHDILWLFNPSHWIRIFCFIFGIMVAIPAMYALMHTGTGDLYLAMGIALTVISAALLFLAFHNLPYTPPTKGQPPPPPSTTNVINLQSLLAWVAQGIRSGTAPSGTDTQAYVLSDQPSLMSAVTQSLLGTGPTSSSSSAEAAGFSPDSGGSGSASGTSPRYQPVTDATGIFPTVTPQGIIPAGGIFPTRSGAPPLPSQYFGV
jgi:hypothetical protein